MFHFAFMIFSPRALHGYVESKQNWINLKLFLLTWLLNRLCLRSFHSVIYTGFCELWEHNQYLKIYHSSYDHLSHSCHVVVFRVISRFRKNLKCDKYYTWYWDQPISRAYFTSFCVCYIEIHMVVVTAQIYL